MPALSPEEKAALKQQKKLEKQRQEEIRRRQLRHDYLSREIKFAQINIRGHEKKWKKMLIKIALPRMKADLEYAWHNFEKIIDFKDFEISLLLDELNDGEEQYLMNFRNHSEQIDDLLIKFGDYLNVFKKDYEGDLNKMKIVAEREAEEIKKKSFELEEYYKTMLFGLEVAKKEQEKLVRGDYLSKLDEESNKYKNIIRYLRANLEKRYSDLWENIKAFLNDFHKNTVDRRKLHDALSIQDESLHKMCADQAKKLISMQKSLKRLKDHLIQVEKTQGIKISDLLSEREYFADAFWTLKTRLSLDKDIDSLNLTVLTVESNLSREHLNKIVEKGKNILKLAAVCRKLETQDEKILPFPKSSDDKDYQQTLNEKDVSPMVELEKFWRRVAQADAIRHTINEEKEYLKKKNLILKQNIHLYCKCIQCPPPEFTETTKTRPENSHIPITDGYMVQKTYKKFE